MSTNPSKHKACCKCFLLFPSSIYPSTVCCRSEYPLTGKQKQGSRNDLVKDVKQQRKEFNVCFDQDLGSASSFKFIQIISIVIKKHLVSVFSIQSFNPFSNYLNGQIAVLLEENRIIRFQLSIESSISLLFHFCFITIGSSL